MSKRIRKSKGWQHHSDCAQPLLFGSGWFMYSVSQEVHHNSGVLTLLTVLAVSCGRGQTFPGFVPNILFHLEPERAAAYISIVPN